MLPIRKVVLSRKLGEKIMIGDNIVVTVAEISRGKVRLGVEAPKEIPIFRQELLAGKGAGLEPHPAGAQSLKVRTAA